MTPHGQVDVDLALLLETDDEIETVRTGHGRSENGLLDLLAGFA